jgi:hypothetical protein
MKIMLRYKNWMLTNYGFGLHRLALLRLTPSQNRTGKEKWFQWDRVL